LATRLVAAFGAIDEPDTHATSFCMYNAVRVKTQIGLKWNT